VATFEKRGPFRRVKIRRAGLPAQTRTFDNKTQTQQWARNVESDIDKGIVVDRRAAGATLARRNPRALPARGDPEGWSRGRRSTANSTSCRTPSRQPGGNGRSICRAIPAGSCGTHPRVDRAISASRNVWLAHFVAIAIETGMRRSEFLSLEWSDLNVERRMAYLPVTKNGEPRGVPLSSHAMAILGALPVSSNGRVFES
jgi:hypothetical protein